MPSGSFRPRASGSFLSKVYRDLLIRDCIRLPNYGPLPTSMHVLQTHRTTDYYGLLRIAREQTACPLSAPPHQACTLVSSQRHISSKSFQQKMQEAASSRHSVKSTQQGTRTCPDWAKAIVHRNDHRCFRYGRHSLWNFLVSYYTLDFESSFGTIISGTAFNCILTIGPLPVALRHRSLM